jgi:DNA-binding NarL/FixJ family response regulator
MTFTRVYLVDDHAIVRGGLRALVDAQPDMRVVGEASDGVAALDGIAQTSPDVVVMDLSMPELGGAEATERLAATDTHVKVVALTAHEEPAKIQRVMAAGASGFVLKRAAPDDLCRAIRTVAGGGVYVDPAMAAQMFPQRSDERAAELSAREEEVLRKIAEGYGAKEIAALLEISTRTFETYRSRAMEKLGIKSRVEIVRYAMQRGWLNA